MSLRYASNHLFNELFAETPVLTIASRNGRNEELDQRRNDCLIDRFFFIGRETKMGWQPTVIKTAEQFFLTPFQVSKIVQRNADKLRKLKKEQPGKNYFIKKWPHLVW
jgi:hypothetical protein